MAVGSQSNVERLFVRTSVRTSVVPTSVAVVWRAELGEVANEIDDAFSQQRLAAGEANLGDAHPDQHARHAQVIRERQISVERAFVSGAAIDTLVVAAVGNGDPQIGDRAAEFVGKGHGNRDENKLLTDYSFGRWLRDLSDPSELLRQQVGERAEKIGGHSPFWDCVQKTRRSQK